MKKNVAVFFGGKSPEHEVSLRSAKNVVSALDKSKFNPILIGISQQGTWYSFPNDSVFEKLVRINDQELNLECESVTLVSIKEKPYLFSLNTNQKVLIDIAFPVLHGPMGEDGSIQGLFKMFNVPFVGCGIIGSAAGMDKEIMKRFLKEAQIPHAKYILITPNFIPDYNIIVNKLGTPFFIKPANAGSSVGVYKIKSEIEFKTNLKEAFKFDFKILAEEFIQGREIECSVLGSNESPQASLPGEVITNQDFYSYEAKYLDDNGAKIVIPANLNSETVSSIQEMAKATFTAMCCEGLTRVDFFLKLNGELIINEINTLPGFTKISMYPKMWEASGLKYTDLITELIMLGLARHQNEQKIAYSYL